MLYQFSFPFLIQDCAQSLAALIHYNPIRQKIHFRSSPSEPKPFVTMKVQAQADTSTSECRFT